jgi:AcrR family transcriptional regulator
MSGEDPRIAKTRNAISAAFWQLMEQRDFKDISIHDVASAARISRTTFYHHYTGKHHWLEQTIREALDVYTAKYRVADLQDKDTLIRRLTELFHSISTDSRLCKLILANENHQLIYRIFRESLLEQFHELYGDTAIPSPQEDLTIHYIAASVSAYIEWWVRNNTIFSSEQLAQCIYSFHHAGEKQTT